MYEQIKPVSALSEFGMDTTLIGSEMGCKIKKAMKELNINIYCFAEPYLTNISTKLG